ncbi:hypothetical protein D3C71_1811650 [compost metagenome]
MFRVGRDRARQSVLLLAAGLMGLVEDVLQLGVVVEHARIKMARQRHAVRLEDRGRGFDQRTDLGTQHQVLLALRAGSLLKIYS